MEWKPYDPRWLVDVAATLRPEEPWLAEALARCTRAVEDSSAYIYFVDPTNPNKPGSEWQFDECIVLKHPLEGDIVLDILRGRRVGGIEFLSRL